MCNVGGVMCPNKLLRINSQQWLISRTSCFGAAATAALERNRSCRHGAACYLLCLQKGGKQPNSYSPHCANWIRSPTVLLFISTVWGCLDNYLHTYTDYKRLQSKQTLQVIN